MRAKTTSLSFVQEKINAIRSALFYSEQDSVLKFPTNIITALKVDEVGQIWFYVNKPSQFIHHFDDQFPARLDFFRKGRNYFLRILGKAFVVTDPEEINHLLTLYGDLNRQAMDKMILLRLKIQRVGYFESHREPEGRKSWWISVLESLYHLLFPKGTRLSPQYFLL